MTNINYKLVETDKELEASLELRRQVFSLEQGIDESLVCEDNQIPFFPADDPSIERGGIAAYGFDYYDLGFQTGQMLARVLKAESASAIAVEKGKVISLSVNTAAAERMGATIPQDIVDSAKTKYDN